MKKGILFSHGDSRPADGSRPTGGARIRELLGRDLAKYFLMGLPALFAVTLYGFGLWMGMSGGSILVTLGFGLILGMVMGPFVCGLADTIFRTLRDASGIGWGSYGRALRQNAGQSILFGAVFGTILSGLIFCLNFKTYAVLAFISMVLLTAIALYTVSQLVLVKLGFFNLIRNSLVLMTAHPLATLKALFVIAVWSFFLWLLAPLSVLFWAVGGLWLPLLFGGFFIYDILNETFSIEESHEQLRKKKYEEYDL